LFLALIDALLEHVQMNTRMDIRDRIAALALVDRVLAREKSDVDAERAGSKVREYSASFQAANTPERAADSRQGGRRERDDERGDDDGESDDRAAQRA
jgi:hypothetical protein